MDTKFTDADVKLSAIASGAISAAAWERYQGETMGKVLRPDVLQPTSQPVIEKIAVPQPYSEPLLNERETTHGDFGKQTEFVQTVKALIRGTPNWSKLSAAQRESLEMDATKTGRILYGDHNHKDSWQDKAGYAKLVAERLT